ncbi:hypothetical protein [Roseateles sp.]|uniref:hypothetical protein n=1 Tax=Roseateles sp. TaxID=1971397 RepID=UPI003BAB2B93
MNFQLCARLWLAMSLSVSMVPAECELLPAPAASVRVIGATNADPGDFSHHVDVTSTVTATNNAFGAYPLNIGNNQATATAFTDAAGANGIRQPQMVASSVGYYGSYVYARVNLSYWFAISDTSTSVAPIVLDTYLGAQLATDIQGFSRSISTVFFSISTAAGSKFIDDEACAAVVQSYCGAYASSTHLENELLLPTNVWLNVQIETGTLTTVGPYQGLPFSGTYASGIAFAAPLLSLSAQYQTDHPSAKLLFSEGVSNISAVPEPGIWMMTLVGLLPVVRRFRKGCIHASQPG